MIHLLPIFIIFIPTIPLNCNVKSYEVEFFQEFLKEEEKIASIRSVSSAHQNSKASLEAASK